MYDHGLGEFRPQQIKVVMRANPKQFTPGNFGTAAKMGTSAEFELIYLNISIEGREYIEIDKFGYKCRINGVDYLKKVRKDLGLA